MQDERRTQKKTVCAFHGHFRIQANHREMDLGEEGTAQEMGRPIERSTRPHRQGGGGSRSRGAASTDDNEAYEGLCKLYGVEQFRSSTERKSGKKRHTANA